MPNSIKLLAGQLKEIWKHLGVNQRFSIIMGLIFTVCAMAAVTYWTSRPDFRLLYSGLSLKDAAEIREQLEDQKIPSELKDSGSAIYVPAADVYRCRLTLASKGLPKDNSAGFELFEQPKFGLTDFAQQVNYQRALQGELERTIATINGIESARVTLVLPKDKLFADQNDQRASASIMLILAGGVAVTPGQVQSIVQLVGSAVPGLDPNSVTVTDHTGRLLTRKVAKSNESYEQANEQLATQARAEDLLTEKAQEMLDLALGVGRSIVKVSVAMDFSKIEKRVENYDNENKVVKSEIIESENSSTPAASRGNVAGVVANAPMSGAAGTASADGGMAKSKKENIKTEYAIPSDVQQVIQQGARISNMSVSVCVAKDAAADLEKVKQMVRNAVGMVSDGARKDSIEVTEMEFAGGPKEAPAAPWWQTMPVSFEQIGRYVGGGVVLLMLYLLSRRVMSVGSEVERRDVGVPLQTVGGSGGGWEAGAAQFEEEGGSLTPGERTLRDINKLAEQNPRTLAAWISAQTQAGA